METSVPTRVPHSMSHPAPRLSHLLESSLYVQDLDRSRAFYRRLFGLEELLSEERMSGFAIPGGSILLLFKQGGSTHPSLTPGGTIPPHDSSGTQHLAFAIPKSELEAWESHLAAQQIQIESRVTQRFGGTSLYFRDPDGHSLEIATPGLWRIY